MGNRKTAKNTPKLIVDHLEYPVVTALGTFYHKVQIGTFEWIGWLQQGKTWSYDGKFTCRREKMRHTYYWYAYKKDEETGKLQKMYLGRDEEITKDKLLAVWLAFQYGKDSRIYKQHMGLLD